MSINDETMVKALTNSKLHELMFEAVDPGQLAPGFAIRFGEAMRDFLSELAIANLQNFKPSATREDLTLASSAPEADWFILDNVISRDIPYVDDDAEVYLVTDKQMVDFVNLYRHVAEHQMGVVREVRGCFEAAEVEGLQTALAETTDSRLKDLVERRLMYAYSAALSKLPEPAPISSNSKMNG